jgi:hypothetical protein
MTFFTEIFFKTLNPKIHMETQNTSTTQRNSEQKKSNAGGVMIPNFKLYYRTMTIKTAWYWQKNRQEDQWIRIEDADLNPNSYSQLIFNKGAKTHDGEKTASSTNAAGKTGYSHVEDSK